MKLLEVQRDVLNPEMEGFSFCSSEGCDKKKKCCKKYKKKAVHCKKCPKL